MAHESFPHNQSSQNIATPMNGHHILRNKNCSIQSSLVATTEVSSYPGPKVIGYILVCPIARRVIAESRTCTSYY